MDCECALALVKLIGFGVCVVVLIICTTVAYVYSNSYDDSGEE